MAWRLLELGGRSWRTRVLLQRGLALVYAIAFLVAAFQFVPLLGEHGLLPVPRFVAEVPFSATPSLFHLLPRDGAFRAAAWIGFALSLFASTGLSERGGGSLSALTWLFLWGLYLSFVNVGQVFYAFGWETMLLEAGFLAVFLGDARAEPSALVILLFRWMLFRTMFGAGLIKIRGDACWRDLTCLFDHYETQPMPNPLSWYFHWLPRPVHRFGVVFNHFAELVVPFAYFAPPSFAAAAGLVTIFFHLWLAASGNFSFLGLLTIVLAFSTLDDRALERVVPFRAAPAVRPARVRRVAAVVLAALVAFLSIAPVFNLLAARQVMNASYDPLHLVNSYGAFGSITRPRYEVVIEGTADPEPGPDAAWREYAFRGKPGDPRRRPPQVAPYHLRLDWLMWFCALGPWDSQPWFANLLAKLLQNDPATRSLLAADPFPEVPPRFVRALLYEYRFTTREERARTGAWWVRRLVADYFPAVSLGHPAFRDLLAREGWLPLSSPPAGARGP